ncbi:MAG: hypothetical protein GC192_10965 [Bacteroidetes bacterium]|nr:hypothetical protein [Bacteroidota bacterium]
MLTIQKDPETRLDKFIDKKRIKKIVIDRDIKRELIFDLNNYGFNKYTLFPGLDGLSEYICWHISHLDMFEDKNPELAFF